MKKVNERLEQIKKSVMKCEERLVATSGIIIGMKL